jgi:exosortase
LLAVFAWAYWTTLVDLVSIWQWEPDYSHGFLVAPLAVYFMWLRRDSFPTLRLRAAWFGLLLIAASIVLRALAAIYFMQPVDGWSIVLWVLGVAWLLGGYRLVQWCLPVTVFLLFMVPLPYRVERWLRFPLQRIATDISCWMLQFCGQPAFAEGNTILLGQQQLEVEQACSGLRIFVGIVALATAYIIATRRPWWEKVLLLASAVPIALISNAVRIAATGLLYQFASSDAARTFNHDLAGWLMIPFAGLLFGLVMWYICRLVPEVEAVNVAEALQRART